MASLRMLAACTRGCRAPGQSLHRDFAAGSRCGPCGSAHGANRRGETPQRERIRGGAERLEDSMIRWASLQLYRTNTTGRFRGPENRKVVSVERAFVDAGNVP